jgi:L-lactate dehydrogenase
MTPAHNLDDRHRLVIVGAGRVGATAAYAALIGGVAHSIVLVDQDHDRAEGEAMDLVHGLPYVPPATVEAGGFDACADADVVVLTAGAARQPGDTRLDLAARNLAAIAGMVPRIMATGFDGVFVVVSNPVDLATLAVQRVSGLPPARVIGTGTTLDTARLRSLLARHFEVDARNVHASVIGEHGESEVPVWSLARIANLTLPEFGLTAGKPWSADHERQVGEQVQRAGAEVIKRKGATFYAVALATISVVQAVLRDTRTVLTVSTVLTGEQGVDGVALSLPCIVGQQGRLATIPLSLSAAERDAFKRSADLLRAAYVEAGGPQAGGA